MFTLHYAAFMARTFQFHAGLALLPVAIFAFLTRRRGLAALSAALLLAAAGPELLTALRRAPVEPKSDRQIAILSANLMYGRADADAVLAEIRARRPDVILFQEWTDSAARRLVAELRPDYPHTALAPRDDAFGQAVFSRLPFTSGVLIYPPIQSAGEPQITVEVELDGAPLRITNVHTLPPVGRSYFRGQRRLARELAAWATGSSPGAPAILAGDFNATARSDILRVFTRHGFINCHDAASGDGPLRASTWPRTGRLALAPGIRLDHVLHAPGLRCVEASVCADTGSDHAPVFVRIERSRP